MECRPQPGEGPHLGDLDGAEAAAKGCGNLWSGEPGQAQLQNLALVWRQRGQQRPHCAARLVGQKSLLGQCLAGVAIAVGGVTNAALLGGLFMNLNFLLAGAPNPSVFYIVIQIALLLTNAGAILGLDARLAKNIHNPLLVAQPPAGHRRPRSRVFALPVAAISLVTAIYALAYVTDWSPAGSVEDSAMIVVILALLSLSWAVIAWLRQDVSRRRLPRLPDTRLALTVTLTRSDDPDDGGHAAGGQHADAMTSRSGPRPDTWRVPAGS